MRNRLAALLLVPVLAACGGGGAATAAPGGATSAPGGATTPTGGPVTDLTKLCDLLGPGDFAAVGITGAGTPTVNSDGPGSAYCVYAGTSAGTGGIEFDAFVDDDAAGTYQTILDEIGPVSQFTVPAVDEAGFSNGTVGKADKPATVIVRVGKLAFTIAAPAGPDTVGALTKLAALVITRAAGITA